MTIKGKIKIGAYQFVGSPDINRNKEKIIAAIKKAGSKKVNIVAFHECALSGYAGVEIKSTKEIDWKILSQAEKEITACAKKYKVTTAFGSTDLKNKEIYNSLKLIDNKGKKIPPYFKRAMYGIDNRNYQSGSNSGIINLPEIKIGLRICFDFRFPEHFRELLLKDIDLAIIAFSMVGKDNKKFNAAKAHLVSRAAENGIYILAANNLNGVQNCPTCIIDPDGNILAEADPCKEMLISVTIKAPKKNPVRESIRKQAKVLCRKK